MGQEVSYFNLFLREMAAGCVSKQSLKKASLINVHSVIAEVKLKRRWRSRRRGGCLTPPPGSHMVRIFQNIDLSKTVH